MFEGYNLHLRNWAYVNLPQNFALRMIGFVWAFATVYPGILMTNEVLQALGLFKNVSFKARLKKPLAFPPWLLNTFVAFGFLCCTLPFLRSRNIFSFSFGWALFSCSIP
ncbi:MAG: hypothetical protein DYG95_29770 [Chlorobi bacterium CHB1]|nr:hypothetical protein [Chlorobi bacterium CHB1]